MRASGTCFGYDIRSSVPLAYLRSGSGTALDISVRRTRGPGDMQLLRSWAPPAVPFEADLYGGARSYRLWVGGTGWFEIRPDEGRIFIPPAVDEIRREERLWGLPLLLLFRSRGDLPLHAVSVETDGGAVILAGLGRYGKTTLARAFAERGHRVLSEDLTCVRLSQGGVSVIPGPAMLRVRRDVAARFPEPRRATVIARDDDRVHLSLSPDGRGDCAPVPVRSVLLIRPAEHGPRLEDVAGPEAVHRLWPLSFNLPTSEDRARSFDEVAALVDTSPVRLLHHRRTYDALERTLELVTSLARTP